MHTHMPGVLIIYVYYTSKINIIHSFIHALITPRYPVPDYAGYDIGRGFDSDILCPGLELFSDRYRLNANFVVSALGYASEQLIVHHYYLKVISIGRVVLQGY